MIWMLLAMLAALALGLAPISERRARGMAISAILGIVAWQALRAGMF